MRITLIIILLSACYSPLLLAQGPMASIDDFQYQAYHSAYSSDARKSIRWPWQNQRKGYFNWWSDKVHLRIIESLRLRPGVRYFQQQSSLTYIADETVVGGDIVIDEDILNAVDLPRSIERRVRDLRIELPSGELSRTVKRWTSLAQLELQVVGLTIRGSYWSGALAPQQFPQPQDISTLFEARELINIAARELAATSALNNAIAWEVAIHPLQWLTGFRQLEWSSGGGLYIGADVSIGWLQTTDLTFKQGRELLEDVDLGQEIRDVLPSAIEAVVNTDEAADILLTAVESRLPLYGFGLPVANGQTLELRSWIGFQWTNRTWSGDVSLGIAYQRQQLSNDHPSKPDLQIRRWAPTIGARWVFNKEETNSSLFEY